VEIQFRELMYYKKLWNESIYKKVNAYHNT
jgi:hypothetical protein